MDLPNNGGDRTLTEHLLSTNKAANSSNGLQSIEFLVKGSHRKPLKIEAIIKAAGCCLQTNSKALLLNNTYKLTEYEETELVPT